MCGDSWFASVKTAVKLQKCGLHFLCLMKTAFTKFPIKSLAAHRPENRGSAVTATAEEDHVKIIAHGWHDKKVHKFLAPSGTTLPGKPARKRRYDDVGQVFYKDVPGTTLAEENLRAHLSLMYTTTYARMAWHWNQCGVPKPGIAKWWHRCSESSKQIPTWQTSTSV